MAVSQLGVEDIVELVAKLTHGVRVTSVKNTIIGSDNGLSSARHQALI